MEQVILLLHFSHLVFLHQGLEQPHQPYLMGNSTLFRKNIVIKHLQLLNCCILYFRKICSKYLHEDGKHYLTITFSSLVLFTENWAASVISNGKSTLFTETEILQILNRFVVQLYCSFTGCSKNHAPSLTCYIFRYENNIAIKEVCLDRVTLQNFVDTKHDPIDDLVTYLSE